jgi:hypothetical protein
VKNTNYDNLKLVETLQNVVYYLLPLPKKYMSVIAIIWMGQKWAMEQDGPTR